MTIVTPNKSLCSELFSALLHTIRLAFRSKRGTPYSERPLRFFTIESSRENSRETADRATAPGEKR